MITGVVCGVRVEAVDDPLMKKIRLLDKLVDELAKGRAMAKVLNMASPSSESASRVPLSTSPAASCVTSSRAGGWPGEEARLM